MTNSDLDRRLREWLEPGADRAREAAVWDVIDRAERTAQRPRWRSTGASLLDRLVPVLRPVGAVAAVVVAVVVGASLLARDIGQPDVGSRVFTAEDLDAIVVWEDTKPPTWHLDNLVSNPNAVLAIPARSMSDAAWIEHPAFASLEGARYTDFTGVDAAFMSWGAVFADVGGARDAYNLLAEELGGDDGWGLGSGTSIDLGDEGTVFTGATTKLMGRQAADPVESRMYLWRQGNVVLSLGGWFEYDEAELEAVARAMDSRATGTGDSGVRP
jgi:hypothetical protein